MRRHRSLLAALAVIGGSLAMYLALPSGAVTTTQAIAAGDQLTLTCPSSLSVNPVSPKSVTAVCAAVTTVTTVTTVPPTTVPAPTTTTTPSPPIGILPRILSLSSGPDVLLPHGVPSSYDWCCGSRPTGLAQGGAFTPWFQAYQSSAGIDGLNVRVAVRGLKLLVLTTDGRWTVQYNETAPCGGHPTEDFTGGGPALDSRPDPQGGADIKMVPGYSYHGWPCGWPRVAEPTGVVGFVALVDSRIVTDNPAGPNDLARSTYIIDASTDWYPSTTATSGNGDQGMPRFDVITPQWQTFGYTDLSAAQLASDPPTIP